MIHDKCHVLDQLMFAVDVSLTLQQAKNKLQQEGDNTANFISRMCGQHVRSNMTKIGTSSYRIGEVESLDLTEEVASIIGVRSASVYTRAFQ